MYGNFVHTTNDATTALDCQVIIHVGSSQGMGRVISSICDCACIRMLYIEK